MIHLPASVRVYLCLTACDMRKSFDGLHALVREHLELDPFAGHLFVFASRRRDRIKVLYWDRDGFAVWSKRQAEEADQWPLIHIESHGSKEGISLPKGEVKWADIQPHFFRLNKATRNHLFIVMAACNGFHGIKAMLHPNEHGASLRLLCGPAEETSSGKLEDGIKGFYTALLRTGDLNAAVDEAQKNEPSFRAYLAEQAFMAGWRKAIEQFPTTSKGVQQKTEEIVTMMKNAGLPIPPRPHAQAKAAIRGIDMNNPFQAFRTKFFMLDLFPEVEDEISGIRLEDGSETS